MAEILPRPAPAARRQEVAVQPADLLVDLEPLFVDDKCRPNA